jgi:hypothetical protein
VIGYLIPSLKVVREAIAYSIAIQRPGVLTSLFHALNG